MVLPVTFPDTRIIRSLGSGSMTLWSVPLKTWNGKGMQKYLKAPGIAPFVVDLKTVKPVKGLTIVSEDNVWRSPATIGGEMVHTSMDFELAKALTKVFIDNVDAYKQKAPYMQYTGVGETDPAITGMCGPMPAKYHPGAVAAWEEAGPQARRLRQAVAGSGREGRAPAAALRFAAGHDRRDRPGSPACDRPGPE